MVSRDLGETLYMFDVWVKETGAVRSTNTVFFKHKHITNPNVTPADAIVYVAKELTEALKGNVPGSLRDTSLDDLEKLEQIFAQKSQSYKAMRKVVEQPPRVRGGAATPTRLETPTTPEMICQAPRIPSDWPPAEDFNSIA